MNGTIIATATLKPNQKLTVTDNGPKESKPNFYMIGNGTMNKHKIQSIDLIEVTANASAAGRFVIKAVKFWLHWENPTGEVKVPMKDFTDSQQVQFKKGYKELSQQNIIKRTKRSHYMFNPNALIPKEYNKALILWDSLK